jgi:hypothetical protein
MLSPVLVTGSKPANWYAHNVLTVVLGGAAEKDLVLVVECVGKAGLKARPFCLSGQVPKWFVDAQRTATIQ